MRRSLLLRALLRERKPVALGFLLGLAHHHLDRELHISPAMAAERSRLISDMRSPMCCGVATRPHLESADAHSRKTAAFCESSTGGASPCPQLWASGANCARWRRVEWRGSRASTSASASISVVVSADQGHPSVVVGTSFGEPPCSTHGDRIEIVSRSHGDRTRDAPPSPPPAA